MFKIVKLNYLNHIKGWLGGPVVIPVKLFCQFYSCSNWLGALTDISKSCP